MTTADDDRESVDLVGDERSIVYGVPPDVAPRELTEGVRSGDETVRRETDGDKDRSESVFDRLLIVGDELPRLGTLGVFDDGERWTVTGERPLMVPLELVPLLVDGRRIVVTDRGEDVFGRTIVGEERVLLGVERRLLIDGELDVLGRRVTMLGEVRELREGAL